MTKNQKNILEYLRNDDNKNHHVSPTEIGHEVGGNGRHSAWASPICKKLVELGYLNRDVYGHYQAITQPKGN